MYTVFFSLENDTILQLRIRLSRISRLSRTVLVLYLTQNKIDYWYYYWEGTGTARVWERTVAAAGRSTANYRWRSEKTRSRALRINDRDDGTGLDGRAAIGATIATTSRFRDFTTVSFVTNTMLMQRCENGGEIRLTRTTIQHNEEAGMRNDDLYRQRMQQLHGRIGVGGPLQRRIVRFEKNVWFRFNKSGLVRFYKSGLFRFQKNGLSF